MSEREEQDMRPELNGGDAFRAAGEAGGSTPGSERGPLSDEAFARDLRELRLWLEDVEPVSGGQGWRYRVLNFYWMDKFRTVAAEADRRSRIDAALAESSE